MRQGRKERADIQVDRKSAGKRKEADKLIKLHEEAGKKGGST